MLQAWYTDSQRFIPADGRKKKLPKLQLNYEISDIYIAIRPQ